MRTTFAFSSESFGQLAIPKLPQVNCDQSIQLRYFSLLLPKGRSESSHPLFERFIVLLGHCCADVTAGREHMAMIADIVERGRLAEAGHVRVLARVLVAAPGMIGAGDLCDVLVAQFAMHAINQHSHLACVDEQRFATAIAEAAILL